MELKRVSFLKKNLAALNQFITPFQVLPFNSKAALKYGKLRTQLERTGKIIGSMDLLIAAQALAEDLTIVTNNKKEFDRIPDLIINNWVK
jgi:tRNA(fMet)-specific endonuclease VapC